MNEKIDQALNYLHSSNHMMHKVELYGENYIFSKSLQSLDAVMCQEGLITADKDDRMLTAFGLKVCEAGGWLKYIDEERKQWRIKVQRQHKEDEKLNYDLRISRYLFKTRWWPMIISLLSLLIAVFTLFKD